MDLTTKYLGLTLRSPLVVSACEPLSWEVDNIKRMEDAGAGAVVLFSLFEEELRKDARDLDKYMTAGTESFGESLSYFPEPAQLVLGPEEYLKHIQRAKAAVRMPIIASLNGSTMGGWTEFAALMEQAGADALELNIYFIPTDPAWDGARVEQEYLNIVRAVRAAVKIPLAVKLSPFFSSLMDVARQLDEAGVDGLALFNRFYQADIDMEALEAHPNLLLSTPQALRLPLTWLGILYGRIEADLAGTSGIHTGQDALKMLMVGAKAAMLCSVLLKHGIEHLRVIEEEMRAWMEKHEYESVQQMQGSMSQMNCADPGIFERAQYRRAITTYRAGPGVLTARRKAP
jgi:dihydroorotate dehydrogenase (fumarate)